MAKDQSKKVDASAEQAPAADAPLADAPPPGIPSTEVVIEEAKPPAALMSFDRWFITTNKPPHHKAGLKAFTKTDGKKTKAAWDKIFANY